MLNQQQLRIVIPPAAAVLKFACECDYCGKLALVRWLGTATVVCDKCLGAVEAGEGESEVERCRR